jgi:hypothetical protein
MAKLKETDSLYIEAKRTTDAIRGKRNLAQLDSAIIVMRTLVRELAREGWMDDADCKAFLDDPANVEYRKTLAETVKPFFTAANNVQNCFMVENGLLASNKGGVSSEYLA